MGAFISQLRFPIKTSTTQTGHKSTCKFSFSNQSRSAPVSSAQVFCHWCLLPLVSFAIIIFCNWRILRTWWKYTHRNQYLHQFCSPTNTFALAPIAYYNIRKICIAYNAKHIHMRFFICPRTSPNLIFIIIMDWECRIPLNVFIINFHFSSYQLGVQL